MGVSVCVCMLIGIYRYDAITSWRMALVKAKRRVAEQIDIVRYLSATGSRKKKYKKICVQRGEKINK